MRFWNFKSFCLTLPRHMSFNGQRLSEKRETREKCFYQKHAKTASEMCQKSGKSSPCGRTNDNHEMHDDVRGFYGPRVVSFTSVQTALSTFRRFNLTRWQRSKSSLFQKLFYCGSLNSRKSLFFSLTAQSKDKDKEEFECPTNAGNGNFADPVTCRRFYQVRLRHENNWM